MSASMTVRTKTRTVGIAKTIEVTASHKSWTWLGGGSRIIVS